MKRIIIILGATLVCLASGQSAANENPLFLDDRPLTAVLSAPLGQAYAQKNSDVRLYLPGAFSYLDAEGSKQRLDVSIKTRGVSRRKNCRLPPLRLNFKKSGVADTLFAGQDKLKLVSPCKTGNTSQQYVILEYLAYRALELVTDHSLKTRLVRLSYVDTDGKRKPWTHLTFIIEDENDLAKRVGLRAKHQSQYSPVQLSASHTAIVELFQFMISNTDFSTVRGPAGADCCHNMQILGEKDSDTNLVPVPYDFDASGIVDASYASPSANVKAKDVRTRVFRGRCKDPQVLPAAIDIFKERRADILALFSNSPDLNNSTRKKTVRYIEAFYAILDDPQQTNKKIISRCYGAQT